ncbi:MAG: hypothetical protein LLG13_11075 [Bacteroidales bacterium]|nr:hypothetical protein [Bacteroidales bacterium]
MQTLSFTLNYLNTLDNLLSNEYDSITTKEDFIVLLYHIENLMRKAEFKDKAWFANNQLRLVFGRKSINGKLTWKLDIMLAKLQKSGILTSTPYDKNNHKTRYYSYSPLFSYELQSNEIKIIKENVSEKYYKFLINNNKLIDDKAKPQFNLLKSDRFHIDSEKALKWIDQQYYIERSINFDQKRCYIRMILDLEDKKIIAVEGEKGGRIFTNFNLIKRELREFCTIDGEKLSSIDLKCSQPFLLASFLYNLYPDKAKAFYDIVINDDVYLWFLKKWQDTGNKFYSCFDYSAGHKIQKTISNRDDAKTEFLKMLFKSTGTKPQFEIIFEKEFNELYKLYKPIQSDLAATLQRLESSIFISACNEHVNEGCLSVHDSLYFKVEIRAKVLSSLDKAFSENKIINYVFH